MPQGGRRAFRTRILGPCKTQSAIVSDISLDSVPVRAQPKNKETPGQVFALSTKRIAMSKAQKSNKENKKPKADKNRVKSVSAYKAAQSLGKPASSQFGKKT
jgi:hypothetical protein